MNTWPPIAGITFYLGGENRTRELDEPALPPMGDAR